MSCCISINYGAIYPLLKRLEKQGLITTLSTQESGSSRIVYGITPKGEQVWHCRMLEYQKESWVNSRARFMIKVFFFQDLEPNDRLKLLDHRLMECRLRLDMLQAEQSNRPTLDAYQSSTFQRGIGMVHSEIEWLQKLQAQSSSIDSVSNPSSALGELHDAS